MTSRSEKGLAGVHVLVTRPVEQAYSLAQLIEAEGGTAIQFPTIEISEPSDPPALDELIRALENTDIAIFISVNAVNRAMPLIAARYSQLPQQLRIAAVGQGTARALGHFGVRAILVPQKRFDSEALLDLPALQDVHGSRIIIFRGEGGRELLAHALRDRGADVQYAACYRRALPDTDATPLLQRWARGEIDVVTVTSVDALKNLVVLMGEAGRALLLQTPTVVMSQRVAAACRKLGFVHRPHIARAANDTGIVEAIKTWRASEKPV